MKKILLCFAILIFFICANDGSIELTVKIAERIDADAVESDTIAVVGELITFDTENITRDPISGNYEVDIPFTFFTNIFTIWVIFKTR